MKLLRSLAAILLTAVILAGACSTEALAVITRVSGQHTSGTNTATSATLTLTNPPTTGDLVIVVVQVVSPSKAITVTDGASHSYTATTHSPATDGTFVTFGIWYLVAPSGSSATLNIAWGGGSFQWNAWAQEYTGNAAASPLEQEQDITSGSPSQTNINLPSYTPTNANDLIVATASAGSGFNSVGAGYSVIDAVQGASAAVDEIQTTATATGTYMNINSAATWFGMVAAFKQAGGGGGGTKPSFLPLLGVGQNDGIVCPSGELFDDKQRNIQFQSGGERACPDGVFAMRQGRRPDYAGDASPGLN